MRPTRVVDCILARVSHSKSKPSIEGSDIFSGGFDAGQRCFKADPQFRDAENLDYRLKPTSPCRKRASDGGDIGCRFTPEMLEMLKLAHELRRKGIIEF